MLSELRVAELLEALGARTPAPASGAACALTGAVAAALAEMSARYAEDDEAAARGAALVSRLVQLADEDSAAYAVCVTRQAIEAGDHWVFVGEVRDGAVVDGRLPLVYHRRAFIDLTDPG